MAQPTATSVAKINNVQILVIENGEKRVAIRPICDALGISIQGQLERLKSHPILGSVVKIIFTTGADGKQYEMQTIEFKFVFGWLMLIDPRNVKEDVKDNLIKYQLECYNALYNHFQEVDEYLKFRDKLVDAKLDELDKARDDFRNAKNNLDVRRDEYRNARAFSLEMYRYAKAQTSLEFPTDTHPVQDTLPDTVN